MKIYYFPSFYPSERDNEKWLGAFTHRQVKALKVLGVDIEVILPIPNFPIWPFYLLFPDWRRYKNESRPTKRLFEGISIFHPRVSTPKPSRFFKAYKDNYIEATVNYLEPKIKNKSETFLFAQWLPEASLVVSIGKQLGVKTVVLGIGDDIIIEPHKSKKHFESFKFCWENTDVRSVVADYLGVEANKLLGKSLPYEIFYSSVNTDEFHPVSLEEKNNLREKHKVDKNKVVIICVGSPIIRKGWLDLFDALASIEQDFLLLGVNGGKKEINLDNEASSRGLAHKFQNMGEIPASEMHEVYQLSDIFCLPSHWEGLANALLEAMSSGLPVVTSNVSGHPEVVVEGENGFMMKPKDIHGLKEKLNSLIMDDKLRKKIGASARESIKIKPGSHLQTAQEILTILAKKRDL